MPYTMIICETRRDVAIIRLNDEKTLNAASPEMAEELRDALDKVCTSSRALIVTGTGRGFCSGANLRNAGRTADHREGVTAFLEKRPACFNSK
jgi:2-(1,2-epoxy-1,2-dihydrophenyl)acetyl-CoA isomerase